MQHPVHPEGLGRLAQAACLLLALAAVSPCAQAVSLAEAFEAARTNDPQFRAASFEREAVRQGVPIARSQMLPQVALSIGANDVNGTREFPNGLNQEVTTRVDYLAPSQSLTLRAPLINFDGLARIRQAKLQAEVAEQNYRGRGLSLVDRVGTTYSQALLVRSVVALSDREVASTQSQLSRAQQRLQRGEGTRTEVAQATAALESARFRQLDSRDQLNNALQRLRRLVGQDVSWLRELPGDFRPPVLEPLALAEWQKLAEEQNPSVQARREAVHVAREGVKRNLAGHLPRLDLVASVSKNKNESLSNLNQSSALRSIGLQLSVPIFNGGGIDAGVRQAEAQQSQTEEELRNERDTVALEIERLFMAVQHGANRIEAASKVVEASQTALTGTSRGLDAGLATGTDVLDAQTRLFVAQRDAAQARYDYLVSRLRLQALAGFPMHQVVDDIDRLLSVKTDLILDKP